MAKIEAIPKSVTTAPEPPASSSAKPVGSLRAFSTENIGRVVQDVIDLHLPSDAAEGRDASGEGRQVKDVLDLSSEAKNAIDPKTGRKPEDDGPIHRIDLNRGGEAAERIREEVDPAKLAETLRQVTGEIRDTLNLYRHRVGLADQDARNILGLSPKQEPWWRQRIDTEV